MNEEQLKRQLAGQVMTRHLPISKREIDEEQRTIDLSFSSETDQVERWFGIEILSHAPGAMVTERLSEAGALLLDHDFRKLIGKVEEVLPVDGKEGTRRGNAKVRFSENSEKAREVWADVLDEIRSNVSVGYRVLEIEKTGERDGVDIWTVTRWEPYEISFVSCPADISVGVGRSTDEAIRAAVRDEFAAAIGRWEERQSSQPETGQSSESDIRQGESPSQKPYKAVARSQSDPAGNPKEETTMTDEEKKRKAAERKELVERAQKEARAAEQERVEEISQLAERFDANDLAMAAIRDQKSVEDFKTSLLEKREASNGGEDAGERAQHVDVQPKEVLNEREQRDYSILRAVRLQEALQKGHGNSARDQFKLEYEAHHRLLEEGRPQRRGGILIPHESLRQRMHQSRGPLNTATDGVAAGDTGGLLIDDEYRPESFIEMLRKKSVVLPKANTLTGLQGDISVPRQKGGSTAYWVADDDEVQETDVSFEHVKMSPKHVGAFTEITRQTLMQATPDVEAMVRKDLAKSVALLLDKAVLYGTGTNNQPKGIASYTSDIQAVDFNAANPTYPELVDMETKIAADDADIGAMAYVLNAAMRGHAKTTEKFSGSTGQPIWEQGDTVNGYNALTTNQVEDGDVFLGVWDEVVVGMWGGLEVLTDPYSESLRGRLRIVVFQSMDIAIRHPASFCLGANPPV